MQRSDTRNKLTKPQQKMAKIIDLPPEIMRIIILEAIKGDATCLANYFGAHDYLLTVAYIIENEDKHKAHHGKLRMAVRLATLFGWKAEKKGVTINMKGRQPRIGLRYTDWLDYCEKR